MRNKVQNVAQQCFISCATFDHFLRNKKNLLRNVLNLLRIIFNFLPKCIKKPLFSSKKK